MFSQRRNRCDTYNGDAQFWKSLRNELAEIRQSVSYMSKLNQKTKIQATQSVQEGGYLMPQNDLSKDVIIQSSRNSLAELNQSVAYLSQLTQELKLQEETRHIRATHNKEDCPMLEDDLPFENDGEHSQVENDDTTSEVVEVNEEVLEVCVENAVIRKFQHNSETLEVKEKEDSVIKRGSKKMYLSVKIQEVIIVPTNVLSYYLPGVLCDSLNTNGNIKFERYDQRRIKRSALQINYNFVVGGDEPFKLLSKARNDDYKVTLQGELLDSRTNLLEEGENDMNQGTSITSYDLEDWMQRRLTCCPNS